MQKKCLCTHRQSVTGHSSEGGVAVGVHSGNVTASGDEERSRMLIVSAHSASVQRSGATRGDIVHKIRVSVEEQGESGGV